MNKLVIGLAAVGVIGGGWYYGSPMWTLKSMREAAVAKDANALSAYVDFTALRADVKADLKAQMGKTNADDSLGELGAMFTNVISDAVIDRMITPAALVTMFAATKGLSAVGGGGSDAASGEAKDPAYEIERGLSQFRVKFTGKQSASLPAMLFTRDGLGWKLSGVDLPQAGPSGLF